MPKKNFPRGGSIKDRLLYTMNPDPVSGCHIWTAATCKGYGRFTYQGVFFLAHRASYMVHHGPIPDGMVVRHTCDTPRCINPDHLVAGTPKDNVRDMWDRGRANPNPDLPHRRGEKANGAKLTEELVRQIRISGTGAGWARQLGVHEQTIREVRQRKTWAHIP